MANKGFTIPPWGVTILKWVFGVVGSVAVVFFGDISVSNYNDFKAHDKEQKIKEKADKRKDMQMDSAIIANNKSLVAKAGRDSIRIDSIQRVIQHKH